MITRYNPPGGWPQLGRAFNHGVVEPPMGRVLHMTGQVAWDGAVELVPIAVIPDERYHEPAW